MALDLEAIRARLAARVATWEERVVSFYLDGGCNRDYTEREVAREKAEMWADVEALLAEVGRLRGGVPDEWLEDAYCLAHAHDGGRLHEAICSLRFQRDALRARVAALEGAEAQRRAESSARVDAYLRPLYGNTPPLRPDASLTAAECG